MGLDFCNTLLKYNIIFDFFCVLVKKLYLCNMFRAYKYRLYPNKLQKELIAKHIGSSRFVYNLALETKTNAYIGSKVNLSRYELQVQLKDLKKECEWLKEINSQSLQSALLNLDTAYKKFFKGAGFPKFKSKHRGKQSFSIPQNVIIDNDLLIIPKFKEGIKMSLHRPTKGTIKSATISVTSTGKYFVSILCDTKEDIPIKVPINESTTIGIDLGIKDFAITSEGEVFENPKYLRKAQSKLKYVQRKYSKYKGKRTKKKLAKLHEDVVNKRKDFLHKVSTQLIRENQTIALETLSVKNMVKNHNLAQAISDASWSTFVSMLEYKADWYGKNILRIGRFAPSSKTCSCGVINKDLKLSDREWTCKSCGTTHDRDILAACNIKSFALKNIFSGTESKNRNELPRLRGVLTSEAHRSLVGG
jgi:putative transposase